MLKTKILNINTEFARFLDLVSLLWDSTDSNQAHIALRMAFERGLEHGKLWVNEYATMEISKALNGNDKICHPLEGRRNRANQDDSVCSYYDSLCVFNDHLQDGLGYIHRSTKGYGRWNYTSNVNALCQYIRTQLSGLSVHPKNQDRKIQDKIVDAYAGYRPCEAGSFPTPERLTKDYCDYSKDEQGIPYFNSLISTAYSHGLYCIEAKNTQTLVADLLQIYAKRDGPINYDNGNEILSVALKNPFVEMIHKIEPFQFYSTEEFLISQNNAKQYGAEPPAEAGHIEKLERLLDKIERDCPLEIKQERVNKYIDRVAPSIKSFQLA